MSETAPSIPPNESNTQWYDRRCKELGGAVVREGLAHYERESNAPIVALRDERTGDLVAAPSTVAAKRIAKGTHTRPRRMFTVTDLPWKRETPQQPEESG